MAMKATLATAPLAMQTKKVRNLLPLPASTGRWTAHQEPIIWFSP